MPPQLREQIAEYLANPGLIRERAAVSRIDRPLRRAPRPLPIAETRGCELLRAVPASNREVALVIGLTPPAINQMRRGTIRPGEDSARALEQHFGVPYRSWFERSNAMTQALGKVERRPPVTR